MLGAVDQRARLPQRDESGTAGGFRVLGFRGFLKKALRFRVVRFRDLGFRVSGAKHPKTVPEPGGFL